MTLIEYFSNAHIDNIAACLRIKPDRMVLVGNAADMASAVSRYQTLLMQRNIGTEITVCDVQRMDLDDIADVMKTIVLETKDCVIDLTGGDACVMMAVGAVWTGLPMDIRNRIRVFKYDHEAGVVRDCVNDNKKIHTEDVNLTVEELIALHGGSIHPAAQPPVIGGFRVLDRLWQIVSEAPKDWNRDITLLSEFESRSASKTHIVLPFEQLRNSVANFEAKESIVRALLEKMHSAGMIDNRSNRYALEYTYTSPMFRYCTLKAGNALEVKTLLEGQAVREKDAQYFHDCKMSVSIDWDGIVHDPAQRVSETRNEIDVVFMHDTTPLFISCKNGSIGDEELYKLNTVAEHFGGPYARKMLIAANLEQKSPAANRSFIQRAWDMDIMLVTDAAELPREGWENIFRKAMQ